MHILKWRDGCLSSAADNKAFLSLLRESQETTRESETEIIKPNVEWLIYAKFKDMWIA